MRFSTPVRFSTLLELARSVESKLLAIRTGWDVEHELDGTHGSITAEDLTLDGDLSVGGAASVTGNTTITGTLDVTGATTLNTSVAMAVGGTSNIAIDALSNYNIISLNNTVAFGGNIGMLGGAAGDPNDLYLLAKASGEINLRIDTTDVAQISSTGLALTGSSHTIKERGRTTPLGEWTAVAFSAGNFTGNGAMTWTVASGDQLTYKYTLVGKTMTLAFWLTNTTVGGTPDITLQIAVPGGFTASGFTANGCSIVNNGTAEAGGWCFANGTVVGVRRFNDAAWTASTDLTTVRGEISFEVA